MSIARPKILAMVQESHNADIESCIQSFPGLDMLQASTPKQAFEIICTHSLALVIIDQELEGIDATQIKFMLQSHREVQDIPLLLIGDTPPGPELVSVQGAIRVDYLLKPFESHHLALKIDLFLHLADHQAAVSQSLDELDKTYLKMVEQNELFISRKNEHKRRQTDSITATASVRRHIKTLQGQIYRLVGKKNISNNVKSSLSQIRSTTDQITLAAGKLDQTFQRPMLSLPDKKFQMLYVQPSDDDFSLFTHMIDQILTCTCIRARTTEETMAQVSQVKFDLIFVEELLPGSSGTDLIRRLKRISPDIPMIFMVNRESASRCPQALSDGALTCIEKEDLSASHLASILEMTLLKSELYRDMAQVRDNIVLISRQDISTRTYNRNAFQQQAHREITRALRYKIALSFLLLEIKSPDKRNPDHDTSHSNDLDTNNWGSLLMTCAGIIKGLLRGTDQISRYDDDKFALLLPGTNISGARTLAGRIQTKIFQHPFEAPVTRQSIQFHFGAAALKEASDDTVDALIAKALIDISIQKNN